MRSLFSSRLKRLALVRAGLLGLPLLLLTGCVHQTTVGDASTFGYDLWVPAAALVGGLLAAPLGWVLRQRSARLGWMLLIAGPLAAFGLAPSLFADRVILNPDHFAVHTGIWGMTSVHEVKFDNLQSMKLTSEVSTGRRGRKKTDYYFTCLMKSGETLKVPMSNAVTELAAMPIILEISKRGIPVEDGTGEGPG